MPNRKRKPAPRPRLEQSTPRMCPAGKHGPYCPEEDSIYNPKTNTFECYACLREERDNLRMAIRKALSHLRVGVKYGRMILTDDMVSDGVAVLEEALGDK